MSEPRVWVVRAGRGAANIEDFRTEGVVAIGWNEVGLLDPDADDAIIDSKFDAAYPAKSPGTRRVWASQVKRLTQPVATRICRITTPA